MIDLVGWLLICLGAVFFLSGTVALIRFPDLYTRLHALTKADNLGLGLVASGLALHSGSFSIALKLVLIWFLIMFASAAISHLIAKAALAAGYEGENRN